MNRRIIPATISAILCSGIIILLLTNFLIDPYIKETNLGASLLDFYENNGEDNKIYIIGDSWAQWGFDAETIEKYLLENNQSFKVYNLAAPGDSPKVRIVELHNIAMSRPKIVVFCPHHQWFDTSYSGELFNFNPMLEDRFSLVADKIELDPYIYKESLLKRSELGLIQKNFPNLVAYKRRLLVPTLQQILSRINLNEKINFNFKVGYQPPSTIGKPIESKFFQISKDDNNQKKSFIYMINYLKSRGITVIVVTMPHASYYLRGMSNESKDNYLEFMNKTDCPEYSLATLCSDSEFAEWGHLNCYGRQNATKALAEILLTEVRNINVTH